MKVDMSTYGMSDNSSSVTPPSCVGVVFGAEHEVYADSGFEEMRDQTFIPEPYVSDPTGAAPDRLEQTVAVFPSAEQAQAVLTSSERQLRVCTNGRVDQRTGQESGFSFILGGVQRQGDLLTVSMASTIVMGPRAAYACQQTLGGRANVVVGTRSCEVPANITFTIPTVTPDPGWATNDAARLANAMLDKVKV